MHNHNHLKRLMSHDEEMKMYKHTYTTQHTYNTTHIHTSLSFRLFLLLSSNETKSDVVSKSGMHRVHPSLRQHIYATQKGSSRWWLSPLDDRLLVPEAKQSVLLRLWFC